MKRILSVLLVILVLPSLAACQQTPAETTTAPTETTAVPTETTAAPTETTAPEETTEATEPTEPMTEEEKILWERRLAVEAYMRRQAEILWRSDADVLYTLASDMLPEDSDANKQIQIVAGRLYQGVPYAYTSGTVDTLTEFAVGEPDANGIYTLTGLTWEAFSGYHKSARLGNDCSSAVVLAWSQIGASVTAETTEFMCFDRGFLPVGDYEIIPDTNEPTAAVIAKNGANTMFAAYAQLQKGDALVRRASTGHAVLVTDVNVVYLEDGSIDPLNSYVTIWEQTSTYSKNQTVTHNHEITGEPVYGLYTMGMPLTFQYLLKKAYLPITCKELIDPSPLPEKVITDSQTEFNKDTILTGTLTCPWFIEAVTITLSDSSGTVQEATAFPTRRHNNDFDLQKFVTDHPNAVIGSIDPAALASGNYHCTVVARLTTGEEFTVRDFDFVV